MIILLSPAKTLDTETPSRVRSATQPAFLARSEELVDTLKTYSPKKLGKLMGISDALATTNAERFDQWCTPFDIKNARPAIQMFRGDVYVGFDADSLSRADLTYAQKHLRILSGLYGVLRPLDLIQPYRLEMGTSLKTAQEPANQRKPFVVNLASVEYFGAIKPENLKAPLISPVFQDEKNGTYKIVSFFAKKARGAMARYLVQNRCKCSKDLEQFNLDGYRYSKAESSEARPVFRRSAKALAKLQAAVA